MANAIVFEFNRGSKATEAATNICELYGDNVIQESTARAWFSRFKDYQYNNNNNNNNNNK